MAAELLPTPVVAKRTRWRQRLRQPRDRAGATSAEFYAIAFYGRTDAGAFSRRPVDFMNASLSADAESLRGRLGQLRERARHALAVGAAAASFEVSDRNRRSRIYGADETTLI